MDNNSNKGVSIYLAVMTMAILLAIAIGLSAILVIQIKTVKGMGNSVIAFYAADTGIERVIYAARKEGYLPTSGEDFCALPSFDCPLLNNGSTYAIEIIAANGSFTIDSRGSYQDTKRAIEISY